MPDKIFIATSATIETEWSEVSEHSAVFSMQGRRPGNEDRAVIKKVEMVEEMKGSGVDVHIWAVMDGHGGDVSIIFRNVEIKTNNFIFAVLC